MVETEVDGAWVVVEELLVELLFVDELGLLGFDVEPEVLGFDDELELPVLDDELEAFEFDDELELPVLDDELEPPVPDDELELPVLDDASELFVVADEASELPTANDNVAVELLTTVDASELIPDASELLPTVTPSAWPATPKIVIPKISAVPAINFSFFKRLVLSLLVNFS